MLRIDRIVSTNGTYVALYKTRRAASGRMTKGGRHNGGQSIRESRACVSSRPTAKDAIGQTSRLHGSASRDYYTYYGGHKTS